MMMKATKRAEQQKTGAVSLNEERAKQLAEPERQEEARASRRQAKERAPRRRRCC